MYINNLQKNTKFYRKKDIEPKLKYLYLIQTAGIIVDIYNY